MCFLGEVHLFYTVVEGLGTVVRSKIYGRKVGSNQEMELLLESDGTTGSNSARKADPDVITEFIISNARRNVQMLRDKNVEGYIVFEGDPRHYDFSPAADFVYPIVIDSLAAARRWRKIWGYEGRGGVVVLFDGEVQSWVNELRNPEDWQPGCIAVAEDGRTWTAIAGNAQGGAVMWLPNDHIPN